MIVDLIFCGAPDVRVVAAVPRRLVRDLYVVGERADEGLRLVRSPAVGLGERLEAARAHLCALAQPPDVAVFLSPDGSDDPAELGLLLAPIRGGAADLVIGSSALGRRERGAPGCGVGQRLAALLIGVVYRQRYSDLSPYRAIRMPAWVALGLREPGYGYLIEMQIKAARAGLRVVEVPVHARTAPRPSLRARLSALVGTSWRFSYLLLRHATAR